MLNETKDLGRSSRLDNFLLHSESNSLFQRLVLVSPRTDHGNNPNQLHPELGLQSKQKRLDTLDGGAAI